MNHLYKAPQTKPSLTEFMKTMTPEKAKQQLEQMVQNGSVTKAQIEQAEQIAKTFGLLK